MILELKSIQFINLKNVKYRKMKALLNTTFQRKVAFHSGFCFFNGHFGAPYSAHFVCGEKVTTNKSFTISKAVDIE